MFNILTSKRIIPYYCSTCPGFVVDLTIPGAKQASLCRAENGGMIVNLIMGILASEVVFALLQH